MVCATQVFGWRKYLPSNAAMASPLNYRGPLSVLWNAYCLVDGVLTLHEYEERASQLLSPFERI
jgi:hypothetical protein